MSASGKSSVLDPKKRALAALERRFAVAKAELQQKQEKDKQGARDQGSGLNKQSLSAPEQNASGTLKPMSSSKKGHFSFSDRTHGISDEEATGPAYAQLAQPLNESLLSSDSKLLSGGRSVTDKIIHELLKNGDSAQKYMQGSRSKKIDNWLLLDSFVQDRGFSSSSRARAMQAHSKRSKKHMSLQQHRKCGSFSLPKEFHKFELFKPMHEMWKDYMVELLKGIGRGQLAQCLLTADLHGSFINVVDCKVTSFLGTSGIMVRETKETFGIITQENKFRVVPKKGSVFIFQAGCWKATLLGDNLSLRDTCF